MILREGMSEMEFINAIEVASFSFDTEEAYETATQIACSISDNAALMIGYVLASHSSPTSPEVNARLLNILKQKRPTPVVLAAVPVVESLLKNEKVSSEDIHKLLEACKAQDNVWNGLGIVECADESLTEACDAIRDGWLQKELV